MSARDDVYEIIRTRLTTGFYDADVTLIPGTLSTEFEVSRTPVREALGLLERDGLLRSTSRGFVPWVRSEEEVLEIFEVRAILDSSAAAAAAERRTEADLLRLQDVSTRCREITDVTELRRLLNDWHDAVRSAAHNTTISTLLHRLDAHVKLGAPWKPDGSVESRPVTERLDEHEAVVAAIADRNPDLAHKLMREHLAHDQQARIRQGFTGRR
ncbi:GntR family transcriptional regulator [Gordonia desulfuricans]|uniref:GntR family transcriptional regulator n=1 Tax=Gordonia desulfuricans TaxID=89051 RepID=A0A7K3LX53_9ACTN|nr:MULTISPECIES: GntR family transcriptional regulator [Gordonia]KOY49654.1 GntR family transcriptional regulator [Gordonia sp. NB41Y]NDK92521.1 GntR family transcriptional regulator [Gordonia desulfuricans]WLP92309.1 GntR family transcriptional regulator [Gordonia sp. NB41Y]